MVAHLVVAGEPQPVRSGVAASAIILTGRRLLPLSDWRYAKSSNSKVVLHSMLVSCHLAWSHPCSQAAITARHRVASPGR
jgi:hypothetical protein